MNSSNSSFTNDVTMTGDASATAAPHSNSAFDRDVTMRAPLAAQKTGFAIGDIIMDRYVVEAELGRGGMGVVYKCLYRQGKTHVALKTLPPELSHSKSEMENVRDNFALVQNLNHPNIANVKFLEEDGRTGDYYLIMECVEGEGLKSWARGKRRAGTVTFEDVLPVIEQIADALDYAHAQGVIHRDIKPGNVMIDEKGNVKILDFGLAAQIHTSMTYVSMAYQNVSGTGPYMAPEQWQGRRQGAASDQYALAVLTYELLSGNLPFESPDTNILKKAVLEDAPEAVEGLPVTVQRALDRALAKDPKERFSCCRDFVAVLKGNSVSKSKTSGKKSSKGVWLALALAALAVGGGVASYRHYQKEKEQAASLAEQNRREEERAKAAEANSRKIAEAAKTEQARKEREDAKRKADEAARLEREHRDEMRLKEERQKTENQNLIALTASNYRHQAALERAKKDIDFQKLDRGQKFGDKMLAFEVNFEAGKKSLEKEDYTHQKIANESFLEAKQAVEWIRTNIPLRENAKLQKEQMEAKKRSAEKDDGKTYAYEVCREADGLAERAAREFEAAEFASSINSFKAAAEKYRDARTNAIAAKIKMMLESAKIAESQSNWQKVLEAAKEVLAMDTNNQEAREYKTKAEKNLIPSFNLTATVDGTVVSAKYVCHQAEPQGDKWPKRLEKGTSYSFTLTHEASDGTKYVGKTSFTCDWLGVKDVVVPLKKESFTGIVDLPGGVKLEMVKIPAGSFTMGSPEGEDGRFSDEEQHRVTLSKEFWLGKFEVTQEEYEALMGTNPSSKKGTRHPVENVSWNDVDAFCKKLNEYYRGKMPSGYRFDLPTEAQWEYACRAGTTTAFSYGNASDADKMNFDGNYPYGGGGKEVYRQKTVDVGSLGYKNAFGLYDMHGNVYEWCRDWYDYDYYSKSPTSDPQGPTIGSLRVCRGGGWDHDARDCRSVDRNGYAPTDRSSHLGFRLALVPIRSERQDAQVETEHLNDVVVKSVREANVIAVDDFKHLLPPPESKTPKPVDENKKWGKNIGW